MAGPPIDTNYLRRLEKRVAHLEENSRFTQEALELAAGFGDFQTALSHIESPSEILKKSDEYLRTIMKLGPRAYYLVDESDGDFTASYVEPAEAGDDIDAEFEGLMEEGTLAWTLNKNRPLFHLSASSGKQLLLHPLATSSRTRGLFIGVMEEDERFVTDTRRSLLTVLMTGTANALESFELYKLIGEMNKSLQEKVQSLSRSQKRLQKEIKERIQAQNELQLMAEVFENAFEGIIITDPNSKMIHVNKAFTDITGFSKEDVIGNDPKILKSDRHDKAFFQDMWQDLGEKGFWEGEIWNRRKNGEAYPQRTSITALRDNFGNITHYVSVFNDISESKQIEEQIVHQANHDALTGLPNRVLFMDRLEVAINHAQRHQSRIAILFFDLDDFKHINDVHGHTLGDILLQQVADRLSATMRKQDTVARLGGDEFIILAEDVDDSLGAMAAAERLQTAFKDPFSVEERNFHISASIGITIYPDDANDTDTLIKNADLAMYKAKDVGKGGYHLFQPELEDRLKKRLAMERNIRRAIDEDRLEVFFQPFVRLCDNSVVGMEALLRWRDDTGAFILPQGFIETAEKAGRICEIGERVLHKSCLRLIEWRGKGFDNLKVAVNLSPRQVEVPNFMDRFLGIVKETGLPLECLEVEITESLLMTNLDSSLTIFKNLADKGVTVSVDDFGTGYSSLSYLSKLPIDKLKIDRSFIRDIHTDHGSTAIVETILAMSRNLGLKVLAEGVETVEHETILRDKGCDYYQGYYCSKPLHPEKFLKMLEQSWKDRVK